MKGLILALLMSTCLLALSVGSSFACGVKHHLSKTEAKHNLKKNSCCSSRNQEPLSSKKKTCNHDCGGSTCKCAHATSVFTLKIQPSALLQKPFLIARQVNTWFFKESNPKPVYLALWMPPNISC